MEGGKKNNEELMRKEDEQKEQKKNNSRILLSFLSFFLLSLLFFCFDVLIFLVVVFKYSDVGLGLSCSGVILKISPYQGRKKKRLSQKKSLFFFSTSRRIKHALKTRNTRHYLDLKYTFLIHTYFK